MPLSPFDPEGRGDPESLAGQTPPPPPSGLTRFLVESPSSAGISREQLVEAVRALIRERDYLREIRDALVSDYEAELLAHREHATELERSQARQALEQQRTLDALRAEIDALLADRVALLQDRDKWRSRAKHQVGRRLLRRLRALLGRLSPQESDSRPSAEDPQARRRSEGV